jgi:CHAT domain-containing protein/tetratricopeptide (TPR) repeat protein
MSENVAPTAEVRAYAERALAIAGARPDGAVVAGRALVQRAWAASLEGRFAEAEADVRRALPALERGGDEVQRSQGLVILSQLLAQRAQWVEAERAAFQAITTVEASLGREHYFVSNGLYALGRVYLRSGRPTEAEPILRRAAAVRERGRGAGDGFLASIRSELAQALDALGRLPEAIALLEASRNANDAVKRTLAGLYLKAGRLDQAEAMAREALAISNQRSGPDAPQNASSLYVLGRVLIARNRAPEAEPLLRRVLDMRQRALGRLHPDVAIAWYGLSRALAAQGRAGDALDAAGRATRLAVEREGASGTDDGAERLSRRELFVWQLELLARALARDEAQPMLLDQAFRAVQSAKEGRTAAAISRMADRVGADDPRLAELLRARSDALDDIAREAEAVRIAMAAGGDAGHRARLEAARRRQAELDRQIARRFPSYSFALGDDAARLADAQGALAPDEAIVDLLVVRDRVFAMVVRHDRAALVTGEPGAASDLVALVRRLRAGVDPSAAVSIETLPRFDFDAAHALYRATLGPAEPFLAGVTHLFIVPDGPLQSIPFGMLLTAPAGGEADAFARARAAPWLARRLATTVEPAATAVRALRQVARPTQATAPFIGIGNPVLAGPAAATRGAAAGRNAPAPRVAQAAGATGAPAATVPPAAAAVAFNVTRGAPIDVGRIFTRAGVDVRALRELAPLPETADELRILARALGAGDDVLVLGRDATKPRVRATDLSRYRVIAFATHGLVAGDVPGFGEPGLVLTPPERATPDDDGLLGASTIARLRLDADLVILSACNTAAADGAPGAEALSGLARAFLYAGSRALMVSHWPVASQATVRLTTGLVEAQRADSQIGRAEALRRSEMTLLDDRATGYYAHPLFWAPFIIVGEGGRPIAVPPPADAPAAAEDDDTL